MRTIDRPTTADALRETSRRERRWVPANIAAALVVVAGAGLLAYPSAGTWWSDLAHASAVSGYAQAVDSAGDDELGRLRERAHRYNDLLPNGPLRDPYTLNADGAAVDLEDGRQDYLSQLSPAPGLPMARIRIPSTDVDLPVLHGTDEATLATGIGHLYGSSLPVGGAGTHAVLTGHSGIPGATLFSDLNRLEIGDTFLIDVAGKTLAYRVDRIDTVLPDDGELLRRVPGEDLVTLLTCTPTGVNTHRLLVRGVRIDDDAEARDAIALAPARPDPGIPWDAVGIAAGGLALAAVIARPRRKPDRSRPAGAVS